MIIESFPVGELGCNCTIVGDVESREALVIDPGGEVDQILDRLEGLQLQTVGIVLTHGHIDHVAGARGLKEATAAPILLHQSDLPLYQGLLMQARLFGMQVADPLAVDRFLRDGDVVSAGSATGEVVHTPGHTPGSISLYFAPTALLIAGDTLFKRGVGRTDLWGGSFADLTHSLRDRLYRLPASTRVICGHGPDTTVGEEAVLNPFVRAI